MAEIVWPWRNIPSLDAPATENSRPHRGRVSLDALRDRLETAARNLEKSEAQAMAAREAAERYRDEWEVARDDLMAALEELNLFPTEPPPADKGET